MESLEDKGSWREIERLYIFMVLTIIALGLQKLSNYRILVGAGFEMSLNR